MRKSLLFVLVVLMSIALAYAGMWLDWHWIGYASAQQSQTGTNYQPVLVGTTGSIGGGALLLGGCTTGTASVPGATVGMVAMAQPSDGTNIPALGLTVSAVVTSSGTVTVTLCALLSVTPAAKTYNVRVVQ